MKRPSELDHGEKPRVSQRFSDFISFFIDSDGTVKLNIDMTPEEKEAEFEPNIINSTVYLICMGLQVSTFAVNYKGHPFMESLRENRLLLYSILASSSVVLCLALNLVPDVQSAFQIIDFPDDVSNLRFSFVYDCINCHFFTVPKNFNICAPR